MRPSSSCFVYLTFYLYYILTFQKQKSAQIFLYPQQTRPQLIECMNLLSFFTFILIILNKAEACFIVHFVLYFKTIPMVYYLQMSQNSSFPYIVHLNQPLNLPNNKTFTRQISPAQMSDIKKVQVVYHHGGLYLDNDQTIDYQCIKKHVCNLTGLYFLDWTYIKERWKRTVPLSFIYASHPYNQTLLNSLNGLNQSIQGNQLGPRTVFFSGPSHMQQYRSGMSFVLIPKKCENHRADKSWIQNKPANQIAYQKSVQNRILRSFNENQKKSLLRYTQLWKTHSIIYPLGFNSTMQSQIYQQFNHIQMIDKTYGKFKVLKYAKKEQVKLKLQQFIRKYGQNQMSINLNESKAGLQINQLKNKTQNVQIQIVVKQALVVNNTNQSSIFVQSNTQNLRFNNTNKTSNKQIQNIKSKQKNKIDPQKSKEQKISKVIMLKIISENVYLIFWCFIIMASFICLLIYKNTRCCHENNYQQRIKIKIKRTNIQETQHQLEQQNLDSSHCVIDIQQKNDQIQLQHLVEQGFQKRCHDKQQLNQQNSEFPDYRIQPKAKKRNQDGVKQINKGAQEQQQDSRRDQNHQLKDIQYYIQQAGSNPFNTDNSG